MIAVISVLLLIAFAEAQRPILVNDLVDKQMKAHNAILTRYTNGITSIAEGGSNEIHFSKGVQFGTNTLKRTGDSFAIRKGADVTSYQYKVGYDVLMFAFGKIAVQQTDMAGYFTVRDNSLIFDFTVTNGTNCKVTMDEYKFADFGGITFETGAIANEKVELPSNIKDILLAHVNSKMDEKKPGVEQHLQAMCKPNPFSENHHQ